MRISDAEVKKLLSGPSPAEDAAAREQLAQEIHAIVVEADRRVDAELVARVVQDVIAAPDREAMIAELRARIEAGTYAPSGDEIAESMIRRNIADRVR